MQFEVVSTDRAVDITRLAATYAEAGLLRHWIIDPDRPEIIALELHDGILVETGRHGLGHVVELDLGAATVHLDPATLIHTRSGSPSGR